MVIWELILNEENFRDRLMDAFEYVDLDEEKADEVEEAIRNMSDKDLLNLFDEHVSYNLLDSIEHKFYDTAQEIASDAFRSLLSKY